MEYVKIEISGKCNSGKSRILYLLKNCLKNYGFEVKMEDNIDFLNEGEFDTHMNKNIDNALESIANKTEIIFQEKKLNK